MFVTWICQNRASNSHRSAARSGIDHIFAVLLFLPFSVEPLFFFRFQNNIPEGTSSCPRYQKAKNNEIEEFLFLRITSSSCERNETVDGKAVGQEEDAWNVVGFLVVFGCLWDKSHPFKFFLIKVIKDSISLERFMLNGMSIDIRNDAFATRLWCWVFIIGFLFPRAKL